MAVDAVSVFTSRRYKETFMTHSENHLLAGGNVRVKLFSPASFKESFPGRIPEEKPYRRLQDVL
ncbi:hypothetical protein AVEN_98619-1, partial [Araneus ventricosus]